MSVTSHLSLYLFLCFLLFSLAFSLPKYGSTKKIHFRAQKFIIMASSGDLVVRKYFEFWNKRNMTAAADLFSLDCKYEDTLYPNVFIGKENVKGHLLNVAAALPPSFSFVIDKISTSSGSLSDIGVQWHVEANGSTLPFTRV